MYDTLDETLSLRIVIIIIITIILSLESRPKLYNYSVLISRVGRRKLPDVNFRRQLHTTGNPCLSPSSPALLEILQRKTPLSWMPFNSPAGSAKEIRSMLAFLQGPGSVHRAPEMVGRGHHVGCQWRHRIRLLQSRKKRSECDVIFVTCCDSWQRICL